MGVIYSYCPQCNKKPKHLYESLENGTYKCPNCGYIGTRDSFNNKLEIE